MLWRSNGTIGFAKIKKGLYSLLVHSGPHALRKRSDKRDMTSLEFPNKDIRQLITLTVGGPKDLVIHAEPALFKWSVTKILQKHVVEDEASVSHTLNQQQ